MLIYAARISRSGLTWNICLSRPACESYSLGWYLWVTLLTTFLVQKMSRVGKQYAGGCNAEEPEPWDAAQ